MKKPKRRKKREKIKVAVLNKRHNRPIGIKSTMGKRIVIIGVVLTIILIVLVVIIGLEHKSKEHKKIHDSTNNISVIA